MHYINHNLRFYREQNRLNQDEVAKLLNTTLGRIKMYEQGKATPLVEMIVKIADMMQVSLDTLIRVKLTEKNYSGRRWIQAPDTALRVAELEKRVSVLEQNTVTKIVTKTTNKGVKKVKTKK